MSVYKAYFIIYEFMHLTYEVQGMRMSILLPTLLLVWGIIAFFQEGGSWFKRRDQIKQKNEKPAEESIKVIGMHAHPSTTKELF